MHHRQLTLNSHCQFLFTQHEIAQWKKKRFKRSESNCFFLISLEHVSLLDPGIDRSAQLRKARYVFNGSGFMIPVQTKEGPVLHRAVRMNLTRT